MENGILSGISIFADLITIIGLFWAAIYGFINKDKNVIGFKIHIFIVSVFKTSLILIIGVILFRVFEQLFLLSVVLTNGSFTGKLWDNTNPFPYLISYFITIAIGLAVLWFLSTIIWTGSFAYIRNIWSKEKIAKIESIFNDLIIESALYKTPDNSIDVTHILQQMVKNGKLKVTANNSLAGDPERGVKKVLEIRYRYGNSPSKTVSVKEKETITI